MQSIRNQFARFRRDQRGMTTVEYVIALCLVGAVAVGMWSKFGNTVRNKLSAADELIGTQADEALTIGSEGG